MVNGASIVGSQIRVQHFSSFQNKTATLLTYEWVKHCYTFHEWQMNKVALNVPIEKKCCSLIQIAWKNVALV